MAGPQACLAISLTGRQPCLWLPCMAGVFISCIDDNFHLPGSTRMLCLHCIEGECL